MEDSNHNRNRGEMFVKYAIFILLIVIVVFLFPRNKQFRYNYEIGKPWRYDLLVASFDFPIYKNDKQVENDKQELLNSLYDYYSVDKAVGIQQYNKWLEDWNLINQREPSYLEYVRERFAAVYTLGVISSNDFESLREQGKTKIALIYDDGQTQVVSLDEVYTPKQAYEFIVKNKPKYINHAELNAYNIDQYLKVNVSYDEATNSKVKDDILKNLSTTSGFVQAGEKIIDKGDLVNEDVLIILDSLRKEMDSKKSILKESVYTIVGEVIIVFGLLLFLALYLVLFRQSIYSRNKLLLFISIQILFIVILSSLVLRFTNLSVYVVPFAFLPIVIRVFFDSRTALFTHMITVLIISFMVPTDAFQFLVLQLIVGMAAVSGLKDLTSRSQLTKTAIIVFLSYSLTYLAFHLITIGELTKISYMSFVDFAISSISLLFVYIIIYFLEKSFKLISALTLVELTNVNSDLMMKFSELAPGSFQHSLQVSNLATEAAKEIGANALLVRTGALYHDIGKMLAPQNFIENQMGGENPLSQMSYEDAAQAIIKHVSDGVQLAKKHSLPDQIISFITTHHGRSKVKYFYNSFVNQNPDVEPDEELFVYPGPLPYSKEMAVLMMADAVEARSRSLQEYSEKSITDMVEDMVDMQIADGQFKEAPISFKDVETVKRVLIEKTMNIYHSRIVYPKIEKEETQSMTN